MLKHKSKRQSSIITVKDKDVKNPKNIANALNNFFTNICKCSKWTVVLTHLF